MYLLLYLVKCLINKQDAYRFDFITDPSFVVWHVMPCNGDRVGKILHPNATPQYFALQIDSNYL